MRKEILTKEQIEILPLLYKVRRNFSLVGGTAVALQIGHRRSVDFDFFSFKKFDNREIKKKIAPAVKIQEILVDKQGELTFFCNNVKVTFYNFPYNLEYKKNFDSYIKMADLKTLAAMEAFALGQRAKWKAYVDMYFIIKNHFSLNEISKKGRELFGNEFNEKLFRVQLSYFADVNYEEKVEFLPGFEVSEDKIKKELIKYSLE